MKQPSKAELEAVASVIDAYGFKTYAQEFLTRPADRSKIAAAMVRIMARDGKITDSRKFDRLSTFVLTGMSISA